MAKTASLNSSETPFFSSRPFPRGGESFPGCQRPFPAAGNPSLGASGHSPPRGILPWVPAVVSRRGEFFPGCQRSFPAAGIPPWVSAVGLKREKHPWRAQQCFSRNGGREVILLWLGVPDRESENLSSATQNCCSGIFRARFCWQPIPRGLPGRGCVLRKADRRGR